MSKGLYKPTTKGMRRPLDNTIDSGMIVQPPRFPEIGGLKSPSKIGRKNRMNLRKPGQGER